MYYSFNDLSHKVASIDSIETARETINNCVFLVRYIHSKYPDFKLLATEDIYQYKIFGDYGIQDWIQDSSTDRKLANYWRRILNSMCEPIIGGEIENDKVIEECAVIFKESEHLSLPLMISYKNDLPTISLRSHEIWHKNPIKSTYRIYDALEESIDENEVEIRNITSNETIDDEEVRMVDIAFKSLSSGQDLWERRGELFPDLIFCENVKDQLLGSYPKFHILQIAKKLKGLQEYFNCYDGRFDLMALGMNARTESETVKTNPKLKNMRLFKLPDNQEEYFFYHIGFTGTYCGRIYFLPKDVLNKCYIGYIGEHLPTKKY